MPHRGDVQTPAEGREQPLTPETPRFHVFLIDTGWNGPVSKVLQEHMPLFHHYNPQDPVYILSREQSIKILKNAPEHIGRDPIVVVYDIYRPKKNQTRKRRITMAFASTWASSRTPSRPWRNSRTSSGSSP